jgi:hypothetical protein
VFKCSISIQLHFNLPRLPTLISCLGYSLQPIITSFRDGRYGTVGIVTGSWQLDSRLGQEFSSPNPQADFHPPPPPQPHIVWVPGFFAMSKSAGAWSCLLTITKFWSGKWVELYFLCMTCSGAALFYTWRQTNFLIIWKYVWQIQCRSCCSTQRIRGVLTAVLKDFRKAVTFILFVSRSLTVGTVIVNGKDCYR